MVDMDVDVVMSVCMVICTRVADSDSWRNVRKCSASAAADTRAFSSGSPDLATRLDRVFEWRCNVLLKTCTMTPAVLFRVLAQPNHSASANTCMMNSCSSGERV